MARKRFNFWLDDNRADDWTVNELITSLKKKGQFTRAIREGLRLWADLRAGNTEVLIELFPQFKDKLNPPAAPAGNGGVGGSDLAKQIAEQIVLMNGTGGYLMQSANPPMQPSPAMPTGNLKALGGKSAPVLPVFDEDLDDLPTIVTTKTDGTSAGMNFLHSLQGVT